jgi:PAS domain S-box-containing protein
MSEVGPVPPAFIRDVRGRGHGREPSVSPEDELLLQIIRQARLTLWAADDAEEDFAIRVWNPGAERFYGYSRDEALGRNYLDLFVNPDERAKAVSDHERVLNRGYEFNWNFAAEDVTRDGSLRKVLGSCFRVWDESRGRYLVAELGIDLSDFDRAVDQVGRVRELSFLQENARTRLQIFNAIDTVNSAVAVLADPDAGGLLNVVRATGEAIRGMFTRAVKCRVWMVDDAETARLATGSDDLAAPPPVSELHLVDAAVQRKESVIDEVAEESSRGARYAAVPLLFGADVVGVMVLVFTSRQHLSEDDRVLLRYLGAHVAVALQMAKLASGMQRQQREDAKHARLAIMESILHTVGNESGRIKLAVDSLTGMLADADLSPAAQHSVEVIKSAAGRLTQVMGELVSMGDQVKDPVELELAEAVRTVTRPVERDHYQTVHIEHAIDPGLRVQAGEYLFREAVANLVYNAVQAMTEADGGGDLRISATQVGDGARRHVQIDIEDSGPGVSPQHHSAIWDYGFTTRGEGHGHGLAQTRGLVRMLNGEVSLMEAPSSLGGAHFRLSLPLAPPAAGDGGPKAR